MTSRSSGRPASGLRRVDSFMFHGASQAALDGIANGMHVEHSESLSDFPSLWIETRVDGVHRYDTFFNVIALEWYTCPAGDGPTLIRGKYPSNIGAEEFVKKQLDEALAAGRI